MFFFASHLVLYGYFVVDEAEGPDSCAKSAACACARWVQKRTGNQAQLTIVALVNPVAQETRIAKTAQQTTQGGQPRLPWVSRDPRRFKRPWAAVGGRSPWDLVVSINSLRALQA